MAALRDPETGRYREPRLTELLGWEDAERVLGNAHHQVFAQWLAFSLEEQLADLEAFTAESGESPYSYYRGLTPRSAREVERQLYLTDLETLLELMRHAPAAASAFRTV